MLITTDMLDDMNTNSQVRLFDVNHKLENAFEKQSLCQRLSEVVQKYKIASNTKLIKIGFMDMTKYFEANTKYNNEWQAFIKNIESMVNKVKNK